MQLPGASGARPAGSPPPMPEPEEHFAIEVRTRGTVATLVAAGSLDLATTDELRRMAGALGDEIRTVVLDLRDVGFIDSSGLGTMLNLSGELRRRGVGFSVDVD